MVVNRLTFLNQRLADLRARLHQMEAYEIVITNRRIESDMGDDYKENEQAKLVMEQHDIWYIRKIAIKKEIAQLKLQIFKLKKV